LLGTAVEAQRKLILQNPTDYKRIYIVPLVMSYHVVLEASNLIAEYLKREGKERYVLVQDDFRSTRKTLSFIYNFLGSGSEMVFSFGEPMDLFGNRVNSDGISIDKTGKSLDLGDYFRSNGEIVYDIQRNKAYTRVLGDKILERYYKINMVFSSHLVAFAAFQTILKTTGKDIYSLFTVPEEDIQLDYEEFCNVVERLHIRLRELERAGKVQLAEHLVQNIPNIVAHGIANLGIYHVQKPLKRNDDGQIVTEDLKLLHFYHNRMNGYELEKYC
ncbi:MAG: glycerol-3-phosphate acyltransferase, partial [Bacteroidota bacterium]